jgi:hypothetical protein
MVGFEMFPRDSNKFAIGRMIETFNTGDLGHQRWMVTGDVLDQLRLGLGRAGDEHRAGVGNGLRDLRKVAGIDSRMTTADRVGRVMDLTLGILWVNDETIGVGAVEVKYPGFQVVDPDDRMIMTGHRRSFQIAVAQGAE